MQTFKVTFTIEVADDAAHPRKWIPETIHEQLELDNGETAYGYEFEEIKEGDE